MTIDNSKKKTTTETTIQIKCAKVLNIEYQNNKPTLYASQKSQF